MKKLFLLGLVAILGATSFFYQSCSKSSSNNNTNPSSAPVALSIQTGAQSIEPGKSISYSAVFVDNTGKTTTPSSVSWTLTPGGGGSSFGSFSGSTFSATSTGYGTITASATSGGTTFTASVPIGVFSTTVFSVAPGAIVWSVGAGTIQLIPVYIGTGTTTYSYASSDATIASVDGNGNVSFLKAGSCLVTVTANGLTGTPSVQVPVLVLGTATASLPVSRVAVTPATFELFRGDNTTFTAKAYDANNNAVSTTFTWATQDPTIATVDQTGKITAVSLGKTVVTATGSGITGQAEVDVLPDTTVLLSPFYASFAAGTTQQFTATTYKVNHADKSLTLIPNPALTWSILTYGIPLLDIATVDATGLVTMKPTATPGLTSVVMALPTSPTTEPGIASIIVGF